MNGLSETLTDVNIITQCVEQVNISLQHLFMKKDSHIMKILSLTVIVLFVLGFLTQNLTLDLTFEIVKWTSHILLVCYVLIMMYSVIYEED